jgi:hypothetical protein
MSSEQEQQWEEFTQQYSDYIPGNSTTDEDESNQTSCSSSPSPTDSISSPISPPTTAPITSQPTCQYIVKKRKSPCKLKPLPDQSFCKRHQESEKVQPTNQPEYELKLVKIPAQGYTAPNTASKDEINNLLAEFCKDIPDGDCILLDDPEFKTTKAISATLNHQRIIIPQNDLASYNIMKNHSEYGSRVFYKDLSALEIKEDCALLYADLMGSIKEAIPILEKFKDNIKKGGILAVTICRRDGETTAYTNQFMVNLMEFIAQNYTYEKLYENVYGESKHMGTVIVRIK